MDRLSESARLIGAINTVINRNGELIGDNTDGKGFVIGMEKRGGSLEGKRIVLLGAGGAARAIAVECALAGAKELTVAARKEEPGKELCRVIRNMDCCKSSFIKWVPGLQIPDCDILINATNSGLYPDSGCPDICYENIAIVCAPDSIALSISSRTIKSPYFFRRNSGSTATSWIR